MILKNGDQGATVEAIQQTLNDVGYSLPVDGYFGPQMEEIVKSFQERNNLQPDGIVGNKTIRALGLSWLAIDPDGVKNAVIQIAEHQFEVVWDSGNREEADPQVRSVLLDYWENGPGLSREGILEEILNNFPGSEGQTEDKLLELFFKSEPWSAAFITWVMNKAGAGDKFRKSRAHWQYVKAAKQNREASNQDNPIWAFRCDEERPQMGDIIVKSRGGSKAIWENHEQKQAHGDIVVEMDYERVFVIGGNVSNSVGRREVTLNMDGFIDTTGGLNDDHFAIVRIMDLR